MVGLVIELGLGELEAGDIGEHSHEVGDLMIAVAHGADGQPAGVELAILALVVDFALPMAFGSQLMPHGRVERAVVLPGREQAWGLSKGFDLAVAGDLAEGAIDGTDALVGIGDQYPFGGVLEHSGGQLQFSCIRWRSVMSRAMVSMQSVLSIGSGLAESSHRRICPSLRRI